MITFQAFRAAVRADRSKEGGYVAVMTALLLIVFMGLAAFAVDVGRWYVVGQQEQRAADAAALAGVTSLPGDTSAADAAAQHFSTINGFANGGATTVTSGVDGSRSTRLRVTVSRTVDNIFGPLLGVRKTTVTRTAVADYAGPVPMGSPCNEFGNDPQISGPQSAYCTGTGQFWANVGSPSATKVSGDAYQDGNCSSNPVPDVCSSSATSGANADYDKNGYFYTVDVTANIPSGNLTFEAFDPAWVAVGDLCDQWGLRGAAGSRYGPGASSPYCTGDTEINGTSPSAMATSFTVRKQVATSNPWDPMSYQEVGGTCTKVFQGYKGDLSDPARITQVSQGALHIPDVFRQWVTLCTIPQATKGTYLIQVKSNGLVNSNGDSLDNASGHNRFSLRAYGQNATINKTISVAAYNKMAIYANLPGANTLFHLAKVPRGAAGQRLNVRLFDVGDSNDSNGNPINGTITVVPPSDSNVGANFANCKGTRSGVTTTLTKCSIVASSTTHQGKWQDISVPIPTNYTCNDTLPTGCWVKLRYAYGPGAHPNDTTSWTAIIEGDPVRLVE